ncbi:CTP synthase [Mycoplasmopsis felifaucium]|uniref:CTP synthase (glutamine hydrolyzing) n=1 Tax=Mycoplasmopsis felifaucium TaxID=35768 RepID=A0ABZ2RPH9_9BACT
MTKFIFTTGGVLSGLGKGVTSASIGNLLKSQGFKVFALKLDPYLNIDPGLLSPIEHGEVYITNDGWKCDLDLGHYERFIDVDLSKNSNYTSGRIYNEIFKKEAKGFYNGKTIQIVPHVTDEIINIIESTAKKEKCDFMLIEIGGTVGDIESRAHIYAISQFALKHPKQVFFNHIAFVPYLSASKEYKSKPSQFSIAELRTFGINPNLLLLRSQGEIDESIINKVANASFLNSRNVISVPDKANVYEIPIYLYKQHLLSIIYDHFGIKKEINEDVLKPWVSFTNKYNQEKNNSLNIMMLGEDVALEDAYLSTITSLKIASVYANVKLNLIFKSIKDFKNSSLKDFIDENKIKGIMLLPGSTDNETFMDKVNLIGQIKVLNVPVLAYDDAFLATVANSVMKLNQNDLNIDLFNKKTTENSLFKTANKQLKIGSHTIKLINNTIIQNIYKTDEIRERFNIRFELNEKCLNNIILDDLIFNSYDAQIRVPQSCELKNHPFYLAVEYHPEFTTRVLKSNKIFDAFINACNSSK